MLDKYCDPASFEMRLYEEWVQSGVFEADLRPSARAYTIMIPPPNVTGTLHIGHALNNSLQDILIRVHRMRGEDCLWQVGQDHAGIATQMVVERELAKEGKKRRDMGREHFIEQVWKWKNTSGGEIEQQLRRLGASADWERARFTMDEGLSHAVLRAFVTLYEDNLIYRGLRLVNWDPHFETAISDLEVQQIKVTGTLWYIRYPIIDDAGKGNDFITIATTRPETMLGGDIAVAVHPEDDRWKAYIGKSCMLPFVGKKLTIIADDFVDRDQGSGAVKISPGHDFNDFDVSLRHNLEQVTIFDMKACITAPAPESWHGLDRFEARKKIIALFEKEGLLEKTEKITHSVPHGDRSGVPVEPFLTKQWFVDAQKLAAPALKAVEEGDIQLIPEKWMQNYRKWMQNIQPWCISRQLWWGHRLPVWYGDDGAVFVAMDEARAQEKADAHYGKKVTLVRDNDVLDTWFSSALWPFSTLGWPEDKGELERRFPTDILVTAFDIIFFWVARMIMFSLYFMKQVPFKKVYVHGLVLDEHGKKMSKSKGNVINPIEMVEEYGCDAVRFTLASLASPGRDLRLSAQRIAGNRKFVTKLWNTARFAVMHSCVLEENFDPKSAKLPINCWIISEIVELIKACDRHIDQCRFDNATHDLYHFVWGRFCDWYLELAKILLNRYEESSHNEIRAVTAWAFSHILRLLHPFMPFVTSEIHAETGLGWTQKDEPLMTAPWPDAQALSSVQESVFSTEIDWLINVISRVRSVRLFLKIAPGHKIPMQISTQSDEVANRIERYNDSLIALARLSHITIGDSSENAVRFVHGDMQVALLVADIIDIAHEQERIHKDMKNLEGKVKNLQGRLNNPDFCAKAPQRIIADQEKKLEDISKQYKSLEDIRNSLIF